MLHERRTLPLPLEPRLEIRLGPLDALVKAVVQRDVECDDDERLESARRPDEVEPFPDLRRPVDRFRARLVDCQGVPVGEVVDVREHVQLVADADRDGKDERGEGEQGGEEEQFRGVVPVETDDGRGNGACGGEVGERPEGEVDEEGGDEEDEGGEKDGGGLARVEGELEGGEAREVGSDAREGASEASRDGTGVAYSLRRVGRGRAGVCRAEESAPRAVRRDRWRTHS